IEPHRSWFDDSLERAPSLAGLELMNSHEGGKITVLRVSPGGAAASAGLRRGDVLRKFNDRKIESVPDFREVFNAARPGEQVRLEVVRDKAAISINLILWGRF
ncbi:MAG: PDZ domain-containing protein, partial [Planctomycetes bacterium]|nr:PDZ domain-containing protein [Planctomycetota bacterium]